MVGDGTGAAICFAHHGQVEAIDYLHHEPGKVPLWLPLVD